MLYAQVKVLFQCQFYSKRNPTEASTIKDYQVFMTLKLFYS